MEGEVNVSVYSDSVRKNIESIPQEYLDLSDSELAKRVNPNLKLFELKEAFWQEIFQAQEAGRVMTVSKIYNGRCSRQYFYEKVIGDPLRMAWMMSPLTPYEDATRAALNKVTSRYSELIDMPITTKKHKKIDGEWIEWEEVDPKKALVLLSVIKNLEDRIKGTAVQRSVNVNTSEPKGGKKAELDMDTVEEKLKELEAKLGGGSDSGRLGSPEVLRGVSRTSEAEIRGTRSDSSDSVDVEAEWKQVESSPKERS